MTQELTLPKNENPIVMRSGLVHWVKSETADRLRTVLAGQNGHSFVALSELGITINTADISEVCTLLEYEDLARVKQGQWQCPYRVWHEKKGECDCRREAQRKHEKTMADAKRTEDMRPRTPEEKAEIARTIRRNREILESKGIIKGKMSVYSLKRSKLIEYEKRHGTPYVVPPGAQVEEDVLPETT